MTDAFGTRLRGALDEFGPLCVGVDPHAALLDAWGLDQGPAGLESFGLRVVEAAAGRVAAIKPQVAFFERFGSAGFAALEGVLAAGREAGLIVIADAKRGDIGSTMAGYAAAWLEAGSPLEADAVTLSPYLGPGSLAEAVRFGAERGKGAFVLAATSNPEAGELQRAATAGGDSVARLVARESAQLGGGTAPIGPVGLVVGATIDREPAGLADDVLGGMPILSPGFGAQGAEPADLRRRFGTVAGNVLASESRSLLRAGADALPDAIAARAAEYREALRDER
ncbi:orotidine-5'-phosphate decarboxylase [Microbacterium halophytorum]|uniref:orotidine-5'-phosphate decarboxylase n=1 Tax=Microbacterium halophytorum TaxID=2067568 RepID=UPI000CFAA81B|nr:orotidine-5'-phosphate decarboxylase [Microbacterium halophytorum]